MKKITSILLIFVLCLGLVSMTGCGGSSKELEHAYMGMDLSKYITLPDYNTYTVEAPEEVEITDADVEAYIAEALKAAETEEQVKEGTVAEGDYLVIDYKGTLADGSTQDGMNAEGATLGPIGSAGFIDGFEEGLIGKSIGETVTLNLQFPDPYTVNEELSGQDVTFEVTIKSKTVKVVPELDDEFVKENTDLKTVDEYRVFVKKQLETSKYDEQLMNLKNELYRKILDETELISYPEGMVDKQMETLTANYQAMADTYGYEDWDSFRKDYFQMEQAEYEEQLKLYAESMVKGEMVIYAIAEKEGVSLTEGEYEEKLQEMLDLAGFEDEAAFEEYAGMSIREYADSYDMDRDLILTECLDIIYDRLLENK